MHSVRSSLNTYTGLARVTPDWDRKRERTAVCHRTHSASARADIDVLVEFHNRRPYQGLLILLVAGVGFEPFRWAFRPGGNAPQGLLTRYFTAQH
jgi:hypothetical protein